MFCMLSPVPFSFFFFFNDTATTEIYTLSLHDALPIYQFGNTLPVSRFSLTFATPPGRTIRMPDRKSTRLNSSHQIISYAVFCLKKKTLRNDECTLHIIFHLTGFPRTNPAIYCRTERRP